MNAEMTARCHAAHARLAAAYPDGPMRAYVDTMCGLVDDIAGSSPIDEMDAAWLRGYVAGIVGAIASLDALAVAFPKAGVP